MRAWRAAAREALERREEHNRQDCKPQEETTCRQSTVGGEESLLQPQYDDHT